MRSKSRKKQLKLKLILSIAIFDCTIIPCVSKSLDSKYTVAKTGVTVSMVSSAQRRLSVKLPRCLD